MGFGALLARKRVFLLYVYALMVAQIALTLGVVAYLRFHPDVQAWIQKYKLVWVVMVLGVVLAMFQVSAQRSSAVKLALFGVMGVLLGFMSVAASSSKAPIENIQAALATTVAIFVVMSLAGVTLAASGIDLGFLAFALLLALTALVVTVLVTRFVFPVSDRVHKIILAVSMALFSVLIAYDTNALLQKNYGGDAIDGATGLFLDVLNIFSADASL